VITVSAGDRVRVRGVVGPCGETRDYGEGTVAAVIASHGIPAVPDGWADVRLDNEPRELHRFNLRWVTRAPLELPYCDLCGESHVVVRCTEVGLCAECAAREFDKACAEERRAQHHAERLRNVLAAVLGVLAAHNFRGNRGAEADVIRKAHNRLAETA
jgi:hypothetical protein